MNDYTLFSNFISVTLRRINSKKDYFKDNSVKSLYFKDSSELKITVWRLSNLLGN
jgi:hypothetical protein